jgi:hypothetical protein
MHPSLTKAAVVDHLAVQLVARRREACERRLAYQRLARAIVSQSAEAPPPRCRGIARLGLLTAR